VDVPETALRVQFGIGVLITAEDPHAQVNIKGLRAQNRANKKATKLEG
jgi:hypothetical protein